MADPTHIRRRAEVTAWRFPGGEEYLIPEFLVDRAKHAGASRFVVDTIYADNIYVRPGDWIVLHEVGESAGLVVLSHREFTILYEHIEKD